MSGITIPATGSGTQNPSVATEVIGADHYQLFKLIDGNVGSLAPVGTSANPFFVRFTQSSVPISGTVVSTMGTITASIPGIQNIVGSIGVTQLAGPWSVVGSVNAVVPNSIFAIQAGAPWAVVGSVQAQVSANSPFVVEGDISHGSLETIDSNPVKIGGFAVTSAWPSFVNSGARVAALFDRGGRILVQQHAPVTMRLNRWNSFTGPLSGTVVASCLTPGGRIIVTDFSLMAGSATAGIVGLFFARSGPAINITVGSGTALFYGEMAPSASVKPGALKTYTYPEVSDPNDALRISLSTSMQVYVTVGYYEAP